MLAVPHHSASLSPVIHRPPTPLIAGQAMDDDITLLQDLKYLAKSQAGNKTSEKNTYHHVDPMADFGDRAFKSRYRMSKDSMLALLAMITDKLQEPKKTGRPPIPALTKLLITIRFLAEGCFQKTVGDNHGHPQSTVSRIVAEVCAAIASLASTLIVWPTGVELAKTSTGFYEMITKRWPLAKAMPKVIGCIDGTQIRIAGHGLEDRENYRNRHGEVAINVQAVCDHNLIFTNVVARWQGSAHDSRVFSESAIYGQLERDGLDGWLLGDAGYPLKRYLLTPLANPQTRPEKAYQFAHVQTRNSIERAFGILKKRFELIGPDGGMVRLKTATALDAITACFVLHNYLRNRDDHFEPDGQVAANPPSLANLATGTTVTDMRKHVIQNFFS